MKNSSQELRKGIGFKHIFLFLYVNFSRLISRLTSFSSSITTTLIENTIIFRSRVLTLTGVHKIKDTQILNWIFSRQIEVFQTLVKQMLTLRWSGVPFIKGIPILIRTAFDIDFKVLYHNQFLGHLFAYRQLEDIAEQDGTIAMDSMVS